MVSAQMKSALLLFTQFGMLFELKNCLKLTHIPCALIPVPRELSSSCQGLAAKLDSGLFGAGIGFAR